MNPLEKVINCLEHITSCSIPAAQMRRILREQLLELYKIRNAQRKADEVLNS